MGVTRGLTASQTGLREVFCGAHESAMHAGAIHRAGAPASAVGAFGGRRARLLRWCRGAGAR